MDAIRNTPELIFEFVSRRDFIGMYLGLVGLWLLWLAARGLWLGGTRAFGWRAEDATGPAAAPVARAWLAIGVGLLAAGATLWFTA